jgi:hypothetical protein
MMNWAMFLIDSFADLMNWAIFPVDMFLSTSL